MTLLAGDSTSTEQLRLQTCSLEPIRTPGAVQPHGAMLGVDRATFDILFASENCELVLGLPGVDLLGSNAATLLGHEAVSLFRQIFDVGDVAVNPTVVEVAGQRFDAIVHETGDLVIIELEPWIAAASHQSASALYGAIRRLAAETTIPGLWAGAARELRMLTRFDRVMVYHFHPDQHGEVVAEDAAPDMEPYLGLHYPASDVPSQARRLYATKLSRAIVSSVNPGSALLSSGAASDGAGIDLSHAELRSVSPVHLQFMRNMGQASTLSLSLVHNGQLVGMITCAHRTPHRVPYIVRQGLEILATQVALQLSSMRQIQHLTNQMRLRALRGQIVGQLASSPDIAGALFDDELGVLDFIPAAGAALRLNGITTTVGVVPSEEQLIELAAGVASRYGQLTLVSSAVGDEHPELAQLMPLVAGILMVPLGGEGDFLAWFRPEILETVNWLGEQAASNRATPLSPRDSFSSWATSVTGRAAAWDGVETEALELCRDLDGVLLRRAESELASMALYDPLTGLPNRRFLMDRIERAMAASPRDQELALLFIDVDQFKAINDQFGHEVGDALLLHVGTQILASTRPHDTVSRIGGDEFVVLCEDTTQEEAEAVAQRVIDAIRRTTVAGGQKLSASASIGVATTASAAGALELLHLADAAMYRAKARGRNQVAQ